MNEKEQRLLDAIDGKPIDRCPVVPKIWLDLAARLTGTEPRALIEEPARAFTCMIDACALGESDAARMFLIPARNTRWHGKSLVEHDETGRPVGAIDLSGGWATQLDRAEDFSIENPWHVAFRTFRKHPAPRVDRADAARRIAVPDRSFWSGVASDHLRAARERAGDRVALIGDCDSATLAWYIEFRGMEQALIDLIDAPPLVHAVMERGVESAVERGKFWIDHGIRILRLNDSVANMSVISPAAWREFILPHMRTVCAELHRYSSQARIYCHICGNVLPVLDALVETGLDGIGPLDPLGGFSVAQARARVGDAVALMGGVHTLDFANASPAEIRAQARRCIADGCVRGSRYILGSGCALPPSAKPENLLALAGAARDAG